MIGTGLWKRARYNLIQAAQERMMADDRIEITIEDEAVVEFVRGKVRSGEYASATDVVRDAILMVQEEQADFERWLKEVILPRLGAAEADPTSLIPIEQVEANLAERRLRRIARAS
jgi:antitoxin ParD1/3/4